MNRSPRSGTQTSNSTVSRDTQLSNARTGVINHREVAGSRSGRFNRGANLAAGS